ncbi:MAG: N-acetylmuramoyl-L-alanine amidase, partial [Bacteroidota bacterium]
TGILHIYDPGQSANAQTTGRQLISNTCPCTQPTVLQRQDWCPAGNCPVDATPASTVVTHLVVHHSATSNTSNDWAGVVRTIWDFHVNGNGWDDIGYNFLVDPLGNIYEGRGNNIRGAHFCGNNTGTLGHCLLGNFTDQPPESAALASLSQLLAWRACLGDIDPLGTSLHAASQANLFNITAHREGCSTACPGDSFFPNFPMFRQQVADTIANCITSVQEEPLWAATLQVTPNPTITREVQLLGLANEAITLRIFNDLGQIIDIQRLGEVDFKVAVLPETAGLYYLSIELAGEQVVRKIIKE